MSVTVGDVRDAQEGRYRVSQREWSVSCRDLAGRKRQVSVFVRAGRVVLVAPPGETAIFSPLDVGRLRAALRDAVVDASVERPD